MRDPPTFRRGVERLGLPRGELARRWGVGERTLRRWIAGAAPIPGHAWSRLDRDLADLGDCDPAAAALDQALEKLSAA